MPQSKREANAVEEVQGKITFANRAPHAKDKGLIWVYELTNGTTQFYTRHRTSGTWTQH